MEQYVFRFARLGQFYQIMLACALVTGLAAVGFGTGTQNGLLVAVGILWILAGSGVVWVADRRERA
jgi:hypothetical protein